MELVQVAEIVNGAFKESIGDGPILAEDLSNVVEVGTAVLNSEQHNKDSYVRSIINRVGRTVFHTRSYSGNTPSVMMDSWEFGSVMQKITMSKLPVATDNPAWNLQNGQSYDPNVFYAPSVEEKFYNKLDAYQIPCSFTDMQLKQSFKDATQLSAFIAMIETGIRNAITLRSDALIRMTINKAISDTIYDDYKDGQGVLGDLTAKSGVKAVNLLYLYNQKQSAVVVDWVNLTAAQAVQDPGFIRFAAYIIGLYADRLGTMSKHFSIGKLERFTPNDLRHTVLLSEFRRAADVYLQSDTYHEEYTKLVNSEVTPFWQGPGEDWSFSNTSSIIYDLGNGNSVTYSGILGVMFDRYAVGVANFDERVRSNYNPLGEFYTNFYKVDGRYYIDGNENFVVFFVA